MAFQSAAYGRALTALLSVLSLGASAWAQGQVSKPTAPVSPVAVGEPVAEPSVPMATDDQVLQMGVVRGDTVIPYTSLALPGDPPDQVYTHVLLRRPSAAFAASAARRFAASAALGGVFAAPGFTTAAGTGTGPGSSYLPADLYKAYGLPTSGGSGVIAIIDAYDYPNALSDFNAFSRLAGLPQETSTKATATSNKVLQVVYATGRRPPADPSPGTNNANLESALDIEWAHAMAPNAKIVLILAPSLSYYDLLYTGVNKANNFPGVKQVSMSFGSGEFSNQTFYDRYFQKSGIVYFASTGDAGGVISYPSCSPYVVGVGGISLTTTGGTAQAYSSETAWSGSGGGASTIYGLPSYQTGITANGTPLTARSVPDVSFLADPQTGAYAVLNGGGYIVGGTSLACPCIAGIVNARQSNAASSQAELTNLYNNYKSANYLNLFHDITTGTAGSFSSFSGWDFTTGVGTPKGNGGL